MAIGCGVPAPYGSNAARRTSAHRRGGVADRALDPEAVWGKFARDSLLEGGGFRTIGTPQRNNFSRPPPFNPPQFAFRKRNRLLRTRNRWFESGSLHRRVRELSVPPETKSDQDAKPRHSIPRKRSLIKPTPPHATFCLGGGAGAKNLRPS